MPAAPFLTAHPLILVLGLAGAAFGAWLALWQRRQEFGQCAQHSGPMPTVPQRRLVLGPLAYGSATERREGFRRKGGRVKIRLASPGAKEEQCIGWVVDRSTGGLCVRVHVPLEQGAVVSVRPVHAPERVAWVQVEVRSCRAGAGGWEVGCRFMRRPSWDVLLHFG
jgi:hypothetical protein